MFLGFVTLAGTMAASMTASPIQAKRAKAPAPKKSSVIKVHCDWADFQFSPDGNVADVIDRGFKDDVKTTVAELKSSPSTYVITWDRTMYQMLGLRTLRYRYLINRETGETQVEESDEQQGMPTVAGSLKQKCVITS